MFAVILEHTLHRENDTLRRDLLLNVDPRREVLNDDFLLVTPHRNRDGAAVRQRNKGFRLASLAGLSQAELASTARVSVQTLGRMEASEGPVPGMPNNIAAVRAALENAGVGLTNGEVPGVKLRKRDSGATIPLEDLNAENDE
ncbi:hypothetical protein [Methylocystis sp.]|uniref:hypothetical protein n=1 Tax=Methylocystis sp. TaxID=1911079 RepID=UPI003DA4E251